MAPLWPHIGSEMNNRGMLCGMSRKTQVTSRQQATSAATTTRLEWQRPRHAQGSESYPVAGTTHGFEFNHLRFPCNQMFVLGYENCGGHIAGFLPPWRDECVCDTLFCAFGESYGKEN